MLMNSVFKENICNYCKKQECSHSFIKISGYGLTTYKCIEYEQDSKKIIQKEKPIYPAKAERKVAF